MKHSDLFREKPINLPLLNVDLPLVTFFWVAPLLFLIFHAYLLLNLTLMVDNVHRYNAMRKDADLEPKDDDDFRLLLTNFPFVHSFFDHQPRCSHVKDAAPQVLALETMTLIPRFLDTSAVLSAKAKCSCPEPLPATIKVTRARQELWVSPETAMSRIAPNAKPTTPRAENKKTCQPFRRVRSGSLKNSVSSLLIGITGNSCAKLAQKHQMAPLCFAAGTVHQSSAAPASQNTSTQGRTMKVWEPMP